MNVDYAMRLALLCLEGRTDFFGNPAILHAIHAANLAKTEQEICCTLLYCAINDGKLCLSDVTILRDTDPDVWDVLKPMGHDIGLEGPFERIRDYDDEDLQPVMVAVAQNHLLAREDEGIKCILSMVQDGDNGSLRLNQVKDYVTDIRRCLKALQATPAIEL